MSTLSSRWPQCFSIFKRSMMRAVGLPLCEILNSELIAEVFDEERIQFGLADEDVYTPAITLWAQVARRVVAQNAGNFCRAKAKISVAAIRKITLRLASEVELKSLLLDDLSTPLDADQAEDLYRRCS